jgi:hypothetical protein
MSFLLKNLVNMEYKLCSDLEYPNLHWCSTIIIRRNKGIIERTKLGKMHCVDNKKDSLKGHHIFVTERKKWWTLRRGGWKKRGDKVRGSALIKLSINIRWLHDSECRTLTNISSHTIQDLTIYYAYLNTSFKVTYYFEQQFSLKAILNKQL